MNLAMSLKVPVLMRFVPAMDIDARRRCELRLSQARRICTLNPGNRAAANGHALHVASLRIIVMDRIVLG